MTWATGWTYERVGEELDLIRIKALFDHWHMYPPTPLVIRRIAIEMGGLEFKRKPPQVTPENQNEGLLEMLAQFG